MTATPSFESELAKQLLGDMQRIRETFPAERWWDGWPGKVVKDVERETEKSRVLTHYVAYLLDRVEYLEKRLDGLDDR